MLSTHNEWDAAPVVVCKPKEVDGVLTAENVGHVLCVSRWSPCRAQAPELLLLIADDPPFDVPSHTPHGHCFRGLKRACGAVCGVNVGLRDVEVDRSYTIT